MSDPRVAEPGEDPGRLLDRGEGGRGRLDRRRERRGAAAAGGLRGGAEGRRQPGPQRRPRRPDRRLLQARLRRPAGMDLALRRVDGRQRRRADRDRRQHQHPRALRGAAGAPDAAPVGHRRPDDAGDEAQRRGRLPLVLHALPDQRLRLGGGDEPGRLRRLLLRRLPGRRRRPADRLEARLGGDDAAGRVDRGPRGGAGDGARAPTSSSASPAASSSPATATTTCPTASSSPARSRTRSRARSASTCRR